MVNGQRHLGEGLAGEDHQSHAVGLTPLDEVGGYVLGCFKTVGFEVLCQHAAADIHGQNNVYAFHLHLLATEHALRASQGNDDGAHGNHAEDEEERIGPLAEGFVHTFEEADVGKLEGGLLFPVAHHVPHHHQRDDDEQQ